jgi:hypothetical protein
MLRAANESERPMERRIEVDERRHRVEVAFTGPVTFKDRIDAIDVVSPMMVERGLTRILLDYSHAWVDEPTVETFEKLDDRIRNEPSFKGCWIALVNPPDFHATPTEDIGVDLGIPVRRFHNRQAAVDWLNSQVS